MSTPRKGMYFEHRDWLDSTLPLLEAKTSRHQIFQVTRVAQGTVYYRAVYQHSERLELGSPMCCPVEQFDRWAKQEVEASDVRRTA